MSIAVGIPTWVEAYCHNSQQQSDETLGRKLGSKEVETKIPAPQAYSEEDLEHMLNEHKQQRISEGIVSADRALNNEFFPFWFRSLERGVVVEDPQLLAQTCVAMHTHRPTRDACILSVLDEQLTYDETCTLAIGISRDFCAKKTSQIIERTYRDPHLKPNLVRTQRGIDYMVEVIRYVPYEYSEQAFAALSYLLWFAGQGMQSLACAEQTLAINPDNTLSMIILRAILRGLFPHWVQNSDEVCKL